MLGRLTLTASSATGWASEGLGGGEPRPSRIGECTHSTRPFAARVRRIID